MRVLIATSNQGKLRDFSGAAAVHGIVVEGLADFASLPEAVEDGATFEENARKKAEHYSRFAPGELVLADDSGLSVDASRRRTRRVFRALRYSRRDQRQQQRCGQQCKTLA